MSMDAAKRSHGTRVSESMRRWVGFLLACATAPVLAQTYISMQSPGNNASFTAPATVTVVAEALDIVPVGQVTLYQNGAVIARSTGTGQISKVVSNLAPGDYQFHATAVRTDKRTTQSSAVRTIHVVSPGNLRPTVQLRAPTGAPFIGPATITLTADASDSDGAVARVEYFANGNSLGAAVSAPYAVTWGNVGPGSYTVTAVATDNNGNTGNSQAVSVSVAQSVVRGSIDGLVKRGDGSYTLGGWACSSGWAGSIDVHMYVGGAAGAGTFAGSATANLASEPSIASACQATGLAYRFSIRVSDAIRASNPEQAIFVHGLSPLGASHDLLANSGKFLLPRMPPPLSQARRYVYDAQQLLCKTIEPETGATVLGYDEVGNVLWSAAGLNLPDPNACDRDAAYASGRRVDRVYDPLGRLKQLRFPDRNGDQDWQYAADGLPLQVTTSNNGGSSQVINRYVYNKRRLLTGESVEQPGWYNWGIGYGHDANGRLASQAYPTGFTVVYAPNALGQPTSVRDTAGGTYASGLAYAPNGALRQFSYGNGVPHTLELNARQMPLRVRDANVSAYEYRYDELGNVAAIHDQQQGDHYTRSMTYDGLDRLVSATSPSFGGDQTHRYTYNGLDNITSSRLGGVRQHYYWYDASNRLANVVDSAGATIAGLAYDVQGNLRQKNGQAYAFDMGNRLRDVPGIESYRYDAQGRRVNAIDASGAKLTSVYTQAGQLLYEERRNRGGFEYVYLGGSLLATRNNGVTSYQHTDALGSPVAVTNAAGQVTERTQYEPYGAAIGKTVDGIGYTGHAMDASTGLVYMQQRYYDPMIGRFLSIDPVAARPIGDNFNRYWYANNNPYRFTDPDGRETFDCRGGKTCASEIKVVDLKRGDIVKTDGATVRVGRNSGNLSVTFNKGYENGSSAATSGPRIVPKGPANADVNANMKTAEGKSPFWFRKQVPNKAPWDYKQQGSEYEEFGNFNYGATGRSVGFPGSILLQEAGKAQTAAGTTDQFGRWGTPGTRLVPWTGSGAFGDDPSDQYWIQQGIRYHDEDK